MGFGVNAQYRNSEEVPARIRIGIVMRLFLFSLFFLLLAPVWAESPAGVNALGQEAARLRGLSYKPIQSKVVSQKEASDYVLKLLEKELKGKEIDVREALVRHLGLMPMSSSSRDIYRKLYASQVRGLYDPSKQLYLVVQGGGTNSPQVQQMAAMAGLDIARMYTIHELGHAIQDQHFDLEKISKEIQLSMDRSFAAQSLIEGDASLLMLHSALADLGMSPSDLAGMGGGMSGMNGMGGDSGMLGMSDPNLAAAPAFFREAVTQPYTIGMSFVSALHSKGGWKSVDQAFRKLPTTSEQIYHPEKYLANERPRTVNMSGIPAQVGGYKLLGYDRAGEFTARILEMETTGLAGQASAGWGGDRFWVYQKGKSTFVVWRTVWDTPRDAQEFETIVRQGLSRMGSAGGPQRWANKDAIYSYKRNGSAVNMLLGIPKSLESKFKN